MLFSVEGSCNTLNSVLLFFCKSSSEQFELFSQLTKGALSPYPLVLMEFKGTPFDTKQHYLILVETL